MAIAFVGYAVDTSPDGASRYLVYPNSLMGGIDTAARAGDLLVICFAAGGSSAPAYGFNNTGGLTWTSAGTAYGNDTADALLDVRYALAATDPASSIQSSAVTFQDFAFILTVWRGVDPASPLDSLTQFASGIDSSAPNPPASLSVTRSGCTALAFGVGAMPSSEAPAITAPPSGFTSILAISRSNNTAPDGAISLAYRNNVASGAALNPGSFTVSKTSTSSAWAAATMILRPKPGGNARVWNGSAWVTKPVKVWNGSSWVTRPLKYWNGSAWVTTGD